jgi:hypothetical protein
LEAETCNTTDIVLTSQLHVDSFQNTFGPCDTVEGALQIGGVGAEDNDITSLEPLAGLIAIGEILRIGYLSLSDLHGLHSLNSVGGIYLFDNANVENIDVFANIEMVAGPVAIWRSPVLQNIDGLSNITFIGEDLTLSDLPLVTTLLPLQDLTSVASNIEFGGIFLGNIGISDLAGLENITVLDGQLQLYFNSALLSLEGFPQAISSLQSLDFYKNYALRDISALSGITAIDGDYPEGRFFLAYSDLRRLHGLENLQRVNLGFSLIYNLRLRDCSALRRLFDEVDDGSPGPNVAPIPDVSGTVHFVANAGTCNSWQGMFDYIFWDDFE